MPNENSRVALVQMQCGPEPEANFAKAIARVREAGQQGAQIRLVALTGWGQEGDRRRAMEAGFDYHLTKPVDPGMLNDLLAEVVPK